MAGGVSGELRKVWVCVGCAVRVRNKSARPIPQPAKWEAERCPKCRIVLAFAEGGKEAETALAESLGLGRRRPAMSKKPDEKPKKPKRTPSETAALKERVRQVALAHPDWSGEQVGEAAGVTARTATRYRAELGLSRQTGPTAEQREQVDRALVTEIRADDEIAETVGVKTFTVVEMRRKLGLPPYRERLRAERDRRIAEAAAEHPDWGATKIAAAIGEPLNNVRRSLWKMRHPDPAEPVPAAS
jgi:hypothetical protein